MEASIRERPVHSSCVDVPSPNSSRIARLSWNTKPSAREADRSCPARIQVHMLARFLEAGQFEEAADNYDLLSCMECGLCSFVCVSRIPIFQYIKLAKYELDRAKALETTETTETIEVTEATDA